MSSQSVQLKYYAFTLFPSDSFLLSSTPKKGLTKLLY